jgi:hypothetical protein
MIFEASPSSSMGGWEQHDLVENCDSNDASSQSESTLLSSQGPDYIMTFGRHYGKRLSEIPLSYLYWLSDNTTPTPDLYYALVDMEIFPAIRGPQKPGWKPPSLAFAPFKFRHCHSREDLWISGIDAREYFGLGTDLVDGLPTVDRAKQGKQRAGPVRFWLYLNWDLRRVMTSRAEAGNSFRAFSNRMLEDVWNDMELGPQY